MKHPLELGLGLIGIGRPWPDPRSAVPSEDAVRVLLRRAVETGIRFLDTAPAYGDSERLLGRALRTDLASARSQLVVATKCGELWDPQNGSTVDHSPDSLRRTVERSVARLGQIDVLQLHKASTEAIRDDRVLTTLQELASDFSIPALGVSATDADCCKEAVRTGIFSHIQFPLNPLRPAGLGAWAKTAPPEVTLVVNRPLESGKLAGDPTTVRSAYRYIADWISSGVILTGTTSPSHLTHNHAAFRSAIQAEEIG
jgi:aryl-alcohol dehydrogenase-like predicted oxidoreductase